MSSSDTGASVNVAARALRRDDREEVVVHSIRATLADAAERVHVHDPQLRVERPVLPRSVVPAAPMRCSTSGVIALYARLGVVGVHLVEVHEPRVAAGGVLVRRDHRVAGHADLGDVADVHEVGPVAQLLRVGPDPWARSARATGRSSGRPVSTPWPGRAVRRKWWPAMSSGTVGRDEGVVDLVDAEVVELGEDPREVVAVAVHVAPPRRALRRPGARARAGRDRARVRVERRDRSSRGTAPV